MDCTGTSAEDLDYMKWGLENEGNTGMLNYMAGEGIDFRRHMVEFMQYEPFLVGRAWKSTRTPRPMCRDCSQPAIPWAISGRTSPVLLSSAGSPGNPPPEPPGHVKTYEDVETDPLVAARRDLFSEFMNRKNGPD